MTGTVVTIGNFDGVHAGHRHLLHRAVELGKEQSLKPVVLTFDPHPTRVVAPERAPRLLTTIAERIDLIKKEGVDAVVMPFTKELAQLTPEEFVKRVLVDQLHARIVLVGDNFRFGHKQAGDVKVLTELGTRLGFQTYVVNPIRRRGQVVSSSGIRKLLEKGRVAMACRLLERPYDLCGDVVSGHGIGSKQTVPTLNLQTSAEVIPMNGVYVTQTRDLETKQLWNSITNVGNRPTFDGDSLTIETFLLSPFEGLTPARIAVAFLWHVRDERKFENAEALKKQILKDVGRAQAYFRRLGRWVPSGLNW